MVLSFSQKNSVVVGVFVLLMVKALLRKAEKQHAGQRKDESALMVIIMSLWQLSLFCISQSALGPFSNVSYIERRGSEKHPFCGGMSLSRAPSPSYLSINRNPLFVFCASLTVPLLSTESEEVYQRQVLSIACIVFGIVVVGMLCAAFYCKAK